MRAAFRMSATSDNDAAPTPNHALIASLLPTIKPPAALLEPDGHTKRTTAQAVIGKVLSLAMNYSNIPHCLRRAADPPFSPVSWVPTGRGPICRVKKRV